MTLINMASDDVRLRPIMHFVTGTVNRYRRQTLLHLIGGGGSLLVPVALHAHPGRFSGLLVVLARNFSTIPGRNREKARNMESYIAAGAAFTRFAQINAFVNIPVNGAYMLSLGTCSPKCVPCFSMMWLYLLDCVDVLSR